YRLAVGRLPAPGAGRISAPRHPLLVDAGDDLAVAGQERLCRAHLRAQRQLALGQAVGAVAGELASLAGAELRGRQVGLRPAGAVGTLVHLAAAAEVADAGVLRGPERAGIETVAAADAQVLGVQHHTVRGGVEAVHRADSRARRVRAVHAGHGHRPL